MQLSKFVHLIAAAVISTLLLHAQILATYPCSLLESFPTPIHMLHSDLECGNHTTSKNEGFHQLYLGKTHNCNLVQIANVSHLKVH